MIVHPLQMEEAEEDNGVQQEFKIDVLLYFYEFVSISIFYQNLRFEREKSNKLNDIVTY